MAKVDLFAPPSKEELAAASSSQGQGDLFAPPSKEELLSLQPESDKSFGDQEIPFIGGTPKGYLRGGLKALPMAGGLIGGALGTPADVIAGPMGTVAGAGLGAAAGKSLQNLGEKYLLGEDKSRENIYAEPVKEGLLGAAGEAGGQLIGKGLSTAIDAAKPALKSASESLAVKQSGAMLKDFRKAIGKGKLSDIGQSILNETVDIADDAGKITREKLLKAGDTVENIAEKAKLLKKQTGEEIGNIYRSIDDKVTNEKFLKNLSPETASSLEKVERFDPSSDVGEMQKIISDKYGKKIGGKNVMAKVNSVLNDISTRGNTLEDALAIKGELDDMINYSKQTQDLPEYQKALTDMRNFVRDKTNQYVDHVAPKVDVTGKGILANLNKKFGNIAEIEAMAVDKSARNKANRMFSPTDYIAGGIGGALAGPKGIALAGANKFARERGAGILARGADSLVKSEMGTSPMIRATSRALATKLNKKKGSDDE